MAKICYGQRRTAYHARHKVFSDSYENTPAVTKNNASVVTETLDAADTSVARDVARNADLPSGSSRTMPRDLTELYKLGPSEDSPPSLLRFIGEDADLPSGSISSVEKVIETQPDELYRKYLKHLGDVKSEGGVLKGDIDTGYRAFDHRNMSDEAIRRLSSEVGDGSTEAIEQTVKTLNKNQVFVDEQIIGAAVERATRPR